MTPEQKQLADMAATIVAGMFARPHSKPSYLDGMRCEYGSDEHYALMAVTVAKAIMAEVLKTT